jgi:hypothetical protein
MTHEIFKPTGTIYSDFTFANGNLYAIFETNDNRVKTINVCKTHITNETWIDRNEDGTIKGFKGNVKEEEDRLIITLND